MSFPESTRTRQARTRPWAEIVYLLTLTLTRNPFGTSPVTLTLRLSDRPYRFPEPPTVPTETMVPPTEQWLPLVMSWGEIGDALDPQEGGIQVAAFDVEIDNTRPVAGVPRFSDLLRAGKNDAGYDFPFSPAELRQVFKGGDVGDRVRLFRLAVEEVTGVTDEIVMLKMSGIELVLEDFDRLPRITTDLFPFAAPDVVGQAVPMLLGRIRNAPLLFTKAGLVDKLRDPITATNPPNGGILYLSTPDIVAQMPTSGIVQVKVVAERSEGAAVSDGDLISKPTGDITPAASTSTPQQGSPAECIAYGATDPANASLLAITRHVRNTAPGSADAGEDVYQVLDEFVGVAGVNLGPLAAQSLSAVYCDGMAKASNIPPYHTVEMENLTHWPPYNLTLVRFTAEPPGDDADATTPWLTSVEMKEIATVTDGCYGAMTVSGTGGQFRLRNGTPLLRCGLDCPCGSPYQHFYVFTRFNISAKPATPGTVIMRFFRGVYTGFGSNTGGQPPGWGVGRVEAFWVNHNGPIAGGGGSTPNIPVGPADLVLGVILTPGLYPDRYVFFDVTPAYDAAKSAGRTSLIIGFRIRGLSGGSGGSSAEGQFFQKHTAAWYGIGSLAAAPVLFLNAASGSGSLLTRPNAGSSRSAAEASMGLVTVDVEGPPDAPLFVTDFPGVWVDTGFGGLELDADFGAVFPATCVSNPGACGGPPSFDTEAEPSTFNVDQHGAELLVDYTADADAVGTPTGFKHTIRRIWTEGGDGHFAGDIVQQGDVCQPYPPVTSTPEEQTAAFAAVAGALEVGQNYEFGGFPSPSACQLSAPGKYTGPLLPTPGSWAFESRYAGFYRSLGDLPGGTFDFDLIETKTDHVGRVNPEGGATTAADVEVIGIPSMASLAALQANDHDTIHALALSAGTVLGTFNTTTDATLRWNTAYPPDGEGDDRIAPKLSVNVGENRVILFRIKTSSMPAVPAVPGSGTVKNFTSIHVLNWEVVTGDGD